MKKFLKFVTGVAAVAGAARARLSANAYAV